MVHRSHEMSFESSMSQFFGDKADGIGYEANSKKVRKQWLSKAMLIEVNKIGAQLAERASKLL